mmetsp:Transcript_503/g.542  ORF Transcript_503/g.542 Transcript_503/m.542 type:complete len:114 (-) Transcript_503:1382-1723(-)
MNVEFLIVRRFCATVSLVQSPKDLSKASITEISVVLSNALVASSNSKIFGSRIIALAIAILCFCPPDSCDPLAPALVSNLSGRFSIKSKIPASLAACSISLGFASFFPYLIFS